MSDLKIDLSLPKLTIEEQLVERAKDGKCVMGWWDHEGNFVSWMPSNLTYYEKLFIIDSLQRRLTYEINQHE
jgi:hypothetical protein